MDPRRSSWFYDYMHRTTKSFTDAIARRTADPTWKRNQRVATMASWLDEDRRDKFADAVREGNHKRFHVARGIVSKTCKFCAPVRSEYLMRDGEPFNEKACKFFDACPDVAEKFFAIQKEVTEAFARYRGPEGDNFFRASHVVLGTYFFQNFGRDRSNSKEKRAALARGETHYQGKKIYGGKKGSKREPFVWKYPRPVVQAVWRDDPMEFVDVWQRWVDNGKHTPALIVPDDAPWY
jgi:hypothetical protein